jgi:hypothetical protein
MTEPSAHQPLWDQLVGNDLSGVTFVRDYLQLQFNPPPIISAMSNRIVVTHGARSAKFGDDTFANQIIGLIGRVVSRVTVQEAEAFTIFFEGDAKIEVSLRAEDYPSGGEALEFQGREGRWIVI